MTLPDSTTPQKLYPLGKSKIRLTQKDQAQHSTQSPKKIKANGLQFLNSSIAPDSLMNDGKKILMKKYGIHYEACRCHILLELHSLEVCNRGRQALNLKEEGIGKRYRAFLPYRSFC
jgi:hypothetical protein